jgi:serine protease Do
MSFASFTSPRARRRAILTSAAVVALAAAGALGEGALTGSDAARAAAISTADLGPSLPSLSPLVDRVKSAVVLIKVTVNDGSKSEQSDQSEGPSPRVGEQDSPSQDSIVGEGSGFFISSDGYIVTNNVVLRNAKSVAVITMDGKTLDADMVGLDGKTDIALLKVRQAGDYPFVTLSKQAPKIGDWVVAIGKPNSSGGAIAAGVVSAGGRDMREGSYDRFLQIDAPFNSDYLGAPAFNMQGEVVGVNIAVHSTSGGRFGVGLAVPANNVETIVSALQNGGVVPRAYLGVTVQSVTPTMAESLGLKSASGAIIDEAMPGTPAAQAGLKSGDIITKVNGNAIEEAADLTRRIGSFKPGDKVDLVIVRDGAEKTIEATLAEHKTATVAKAENADALQNEAASTLGVALARADEVAGAGDKGVAIVAVDPNGAGAAEGLTAGDVILDVAGKPVSTPEDVKSGFASAKSQGKKAVLMRVQTADGNRYVAVSFPEA